MVSTINMSIQLEFSDLSTRLPFGGEVVTFYKAVSVVALSQGESIPKRDSIMLVIMEWFAITDTKVKYLMAADAMHRRTP